MAGSTPIFGFPYPESSDLVANYPALGQDLAEDIESVLSAGFGKVLQVVRATDTTNRTTTSTSFVDVTGMSVTITPQKSTSAILIMGIGMTGKQVASDNLIYEFLLSDSSNNAISGAENTFFGTVNVTGTGTREFYSPISIIGYATPATTFAVTYKMRFRTSGSGTVNLINASQTGQMYAIEVSA